MGDGTAANPMGDGIAAYRWEMAQQHTNGRWHSSIPMEDDTAAYQWEMAQQQTKWEMA